MNSTNDTGVVADPASGQTSCTHRLRGLAGTGFIATLAAMLATTLAAALAHAVGVDFEVPSGGETISFVRVRRGDRRLLGRGRRPCRRSSPLERSPRRAIRVDGGYADRDLAGPALLSGANTATTTALIGLHLVAATVMIPTLARSLRTRTD